MSSGEQTPTRAGSGSGRPVRRRVQARLIAAGIGLGLIIVFAVVNLHKVKVDWIVTTTDTSLTVVIAVSFVLGVLGGILLWRRRSAR